MEVEDTNLTRALKSKLLNDEYLVACINKIVGW